MSIIYNIKEMPSGTPFDATFFDDDSVGSEVKQWIVDHYIIVLDGTYEFQTQSNKYFELESSLITKIIRRWLSSTIYLYTDEYIAVGKYAFDDYTMTTHVPAGTYPNSSNSLKYVVNSSGLITEILLFNVTFNRYEETLSLVQSDKNNKFDAIFSTADGVSPYSVTTGAGELIEGISGAGNEIRFIDWRMNATRTTTFTDDVGVVTTGYTATLQYIADPTYYDDYTFNIDGTLVVTPNVPATGDQLVNIQYQLFFNGSAISGLVSTPSFTNLTLANHVLQVTDEYGSKIDVDMIFVAEDSLTNVLELKDLMFTNDPMVVAWDSTLKSSQQMKYKFTLYNILDEEIIKTSIYADLENSYYGIYNMNMIFNNYTTTTPYFKITDSVVTDSIYKYSYNVNDQTTGSGTTITDKYCMKGATTYGENFIMDNYIGEPSSSHKFASNWVGRRLLRVDDYATINYLNGKFNTTNITGEFTHIAFVRYNQGELEHTFTSNDSWYHDANRVNYLPIGFDNLNFINKLLTLPIGIQNFQDAIDVNNVYDASGNTIPNNFLNSLLTSFYEIQLVNIDGANVNQKSESNFININKDEMCLKYNPTPFLWLDNYGNYNTFTFNGLNQKNFNIERNETNRDYYGLNSSNEWSYDIGDRGRKNNNIKKTEQHNVISGWLDDNMSTNLIGLYSSSDVYVLINNEKYPIIIETNKVEEKNINKNRLFNHKISYTMAYDINTNY